MFLIGISFPDKHPIEPPWSRVRPPSEDVFTTSEQLASQALQGGLWQVACGGPGFLPANETQNL
jgi:hypothetical protein